MARCRVTRAWPGFLLLMGWLSLSAGGVPAQSAQENLPLGVPRKTLDNAKLLAGRLANVQTMLDQEQWSEAIDEFQHILDKAGDDLVLVTPRHLMQARRICQIRLAGLPEPALKLYRGRVDAQAKRWLEQGAAQRDVRRLRRLVDETFASRSTEPALDLLGDLAFERGDFEEAEVWWRMLARPVSETGRKRRADELTYPDPQGDPALVRAKQFLARLFRGDRSGLADELKAYAAAHPKAEGNLAGRQGVYQVTLQAMFDQADALTVPPSATSWTTFAGAARRTFVPAPAPRYLQLDGPRRLPLHDPPRHVDPEAVPVVMTPTRAAQALAVHPVIVGDQVLIADATQVTAFDLIKGERSVWYSLPPNKIEAEPKLPVQPEARYTLTAADGRVYARLGALSLPPRNGTGVNLLVCLNVRPQPGEVRLRWKIQPGEQEMDPPGIFEGAPVVRDGRVYTAVTRFDGRQAITAIACYDADTGARRWRQDVCEQELRDAEPRYRHHLLTATGPNVVYCSHAGAVVAVDAVNGRRVWAVRYPSRGSRTDDGDQSPRDLAPCVDADGRLFVAPDDLDRILCLDSSTGQMLWESRSIEVVHLLGVAKGRLIFTTGSRPRGIRALAAATGDDLREWLQPGDGQSELPSFGRGLLAGDLVFWPTVNGLRVLDQQDGQPLPDVDLTRLRHIHRGNMAYGNGCLVVADASELFIYVPPSRLREQRKQEATAAPQQASAQFRLALSEADAGQTELAISHFALAEKWAGPDARWLQTPLGAEARRRRYDLVLEMAAQAQTEKRWEDAALLLARAAAKEFTLDARLGALRRNADLWIAAKQPSRAVEVGQRVLADHSLHKGLITGPDGSVQLAASWARGKIKQWLGKGEPLPGDRPSKPENPSAATLRQRTLTPPLHQAWQVSLTNGGPADGVSFRERMLLAEREGATSAKADYLFFVRGPQLLCRDGATGKMCWAHKLDETPRWIGRHANLVVAATERTVQAFRLVDGKELWGLEGADTDRESGELSAFQLSVGRLFFLQGERRLFALDATNGDILWTQWAPGARVQPLDPGGRFHPFFHTGRETVVIQTSGGMRLVFDSRSGRRLHEATTSRHPWPRPPFALDERRLCLLPDARHVLILDAATGEELWHRPIERAASLTGEPPQVLAKGDTLLLLVARNQGYEWQRLEGALGAPRWSEAVWAGRERIDLEHGVLDDRAVYVVHDNLLQARALANGKPLWQVPLTGPAGPWQVVWGRDTLIVYPLRTQGGVAAEAHLRRFAERWLRQSWRQAFPWPAVREWSRLAACLEDAATRHSFPVVLCDPKDGKIVQRLNFAPAGTQATVAVLDRQLAVASGTEAWGLTMAGND